MLRLEPATRDHRGFVLRSFASTLADASALPRSHVERHVGMLNRLMCGNGNVLVATHAQDPQAFLGWAAEDDGRLVFAYVPHRLRRLGIARHLVSALFQRGPLRLVYWTHYAQQAQDHGFPVIQDWREYARRERLAVRAAQFTTLAERTA